MGSDGVIKSRDSPPPQSLIRLSCLQGLRRGTSGPEGGPTVASVAHLGPSPDDGQGLALSPKSPLSLGPPPHQDRRLGPQEAKGP